MSTEDRIALGQMQPSQPSQPVMNALPISKGKLALALCVDENARTRRSGFYMVNVGPNSQSKDHEVSREERTLCCLSDRAR